MTYNDMFETISIQCCLECKIHFDTIFNTSMCLMIWAVDTFIRGFQEYHRISTCL